MVRYFFVIDDSSILRHYPFMTFNISSLLLYPFEKGQILSLNKDDKNLIWNAPYFIHSFDNTNYLIDFKPYADEWAAQGAQISTQLSEANTYQNIFAVLPKQKDFMIYMIAKSLEVLVDDGLLVTVAANDAGGKKIETAMKNLGLKSNSLSKSKCRIVWAYKNNINKEQLKISIKQGVQKEIDIENNRYISKAGIFGWDKIDKGSQILIKNIKADLSGTGADFGCGYGYLSSEILNKNNNIKIFYLIEADYNALECAKENLKPHSHKTEYLWADLTKNLADIEPLDWVIMNPPFHEGKMTNSSIGQQFIVTAASSLKKNGTLYMVSNVHLPYEKILNDNFSKVDKIFEDKGYKVFKAIK